MNATSKLTPAGALPEATSKAALQPRKSPFWKPLLAMMLGACLASCEKPAAKTGALTEEVEEKKVVILTCDQYFNPEVLVKFTERTGLQVDLVTYESTEEMEEKLKSNPQNYDVLVGEQAAMVSLRFGRLLSELDYNLLPHQKNLDPRYLNQPFDPENKFTLPYMWGTTVLAYRKDHFPTPPKHSLNLLFDTALAGKISLLDDRNECFSMMIRYLGLPGDTTEMAHLSKATGSLLDLVQRQKARFGSDNDMKEHLIDGSSSVAMIYNGDAALIAQDNPLIGYFIPQEGAVMWVDSFAIPRDSQRIKNAHKMIDFLIEAEIAALGSNFLRYASPNKAAGPFIEKSLLDDQVIYPPADVLARCSTVPLWKKDELRIMNNGWRLAQESLPERTSQIADKALIPVPKPDEPARAVTDTQNTP
jgi:spermidine/putrescine transport system substrate-binding protein